MSEKIIEKTDPIGAPEMSFDVLIAMYWRRQEAQNVSFESDEEEDKVQEALDMCCTGKIETSALSEAIAFAEGTAENNAYAAGFKDGVRLMRLLQNL